MKKEEQNMTHMLSLINEHHNLLPKHSVNLKKYKHLNLCEDYKLFLQHLGFIDFTTLKLSDLHQKSNTTMVTYYFDQVVNLTPPGDTFEEEFEYTNKLFYEIGTAYNGDSLVQIHTGKYRGQVMLTDHETFPIDTELIEEIGDLESKTPDEILDYLIEENDCLMSFEVIGIINVADFFIQKLKGLPKLETQKIEELATIITERSTHLTKHPIDLTTYESFNLCEDYKLFLQKVGRVNFRELGSSAIESTLENSSSAHIFNTIYQVHEPSSYFKEADHHENYEEATAYTRKLFYELGTDGSDGSCLVQIHTGKYRGLIMYADYGAFPLDGELEENFGPINSKSVDEIIDYLIENYACLSTLKDLKIQNFAEFFIAKMNTISLYEKPENVPAEAVWVAKDKQWELGEKDADGNPIGEWNYWAAPLGNLASHAIYKPKGTMTFVRYHTDGTLSQQGQKKNNKQTGTWVWQGSENPTTENWMSGFPPSIFKCEAVYNKGSLMSIKYWNKEGVEVNGYGNPI